MYNTYKEADIFIDGAAKGNPGPAGAGVYITVSKDKKQPYQKPPTILKKSFNLGNQTNNMAEYMALFQAVRLAKKLDIKNIHIYSDSQLVVNQINGKFVVRDIKLQKIKAIIDEYLKTFKSFDMTYIPRDQNREADILANIGVKQSNETFMDVEDLTKSKLELETQLIKNPDDVKIKNNLNLNNRQLNEILNDYEFDI